MTVVITGDDLRQARKAANIGLRAMARETGLTHGHLSRMERGDHDRPVTPAMVRDYARVTGDKSLLTQVVVRHHAPPTDGLINGDSGVSSDAMKRRTAVFGSVAAAFALTGLRERPLADRIGEADVIDLQNGMDRLYRLDYKVGGADLWRSAGGLVNEATTSLEYSTYTETVAAQLVRVTANLHLCQGWLAFDAGRIDAARASFNEALTLTSGNRQLHDVAAHAMANLAAVSNILRRPREASRYSEGAAVAAADAPELARLAALPCLRTTVAAAMDHDRTASDAAITLARKVIDDQADRKVAEWLSFLTVAELDGIEGTAATELGDYARADRLFQQAIDASPDRYQRNRALYRVRQARARLCNKQIDGAAEAGSAALDDLACDLGSWRVVTELDEVARGAAGYPTTTPSVQAFLDRYRELRT